MRPLLPLTAVLATLAACAAPLPPANPARVSLLSDTLSVHFYDGTVCRADIAAAPQGVLADCPHPLAYAVEIIRPTYVTGAEGLFEPYATITLTADGGRSWTWRTPQGSVDRTQGLSSGTVKHY